MRGFTLFKTAEQMRFEEAGVWIIRLQEEGEDERVVAEWLAWYSAPENRLAFDEVQAVQEGMRGINQREKAAFDSMLSSLKEGGSSWTRWIPALQVPRIGGWAAASLAIVVATVGLLAWNGDLFGPDRVNGTLFTERGAHRLGNLPDGSVVHLGGSSSLSLSFTREIRYLVLESGEAFFEVAKDSTRPFIVQAGTVRVKAIGTEFNVRRSGRNTFVSVREGAVEVTRDGESIPAVVEARRAPAEPAASVDGLADVVRLQSGELGAAIYAAPTIKVAAISPAAVASWQQGRLEFIAEPLPSVIATVNRYSRRDILLTDPTALADMRFTGVVVESQIDDWIAAIPEVFPVKASIAGKGAVLLSPTTP